MKKIFTLLFLAALSMGLYAEKQVSGVVVDANGEPVIGASIQAKGTTQGTISDYDGKFEMEVPESVKTLVVSFVGMATQEVAAGKNIKVVMSENSEVIQEVVVTGYGTVAKGAYAGSAQAVKAEDIEKKNPSDVTKALAGEVAGVQVVTSSGQPGTIADIRIRGIGSISANSAPLYVVDGIPLDAGSVSSIDPGDIASTTILKDATATSLYGSRGANGVVLITTKKGSSNGDEGKIEIDVKSGANMRLLPMYDVIDSPEDYIVLCWQSLYNERRVCKGLQELQSVNYAKNHLFGSGGIPTIYNLWDKAGNLLINPYDAAGNVNPSFDKTISRLDAYKTMDSWYNTLFHNGLKLETTAKISGGNEKLNYYTSFGYLKDEGYYTASDFQRFNTRANINYQAKKWLKGGLNIQYSYASINNPVQDDNAANNGFLFVNEIPPIYPVYVRDANGNIAIDPKTGGKMYDYGDNGVENIGQEGGRPYSFGINPAGALQWDKQRTVRHQTAATAFLEFKLYEGLKFTVNAGVQYMNNRINSLTNKYYGDAAGVGRIGNAQYNYLAFTSNQLLEYNKTFNEHNIRLMAGHEITYFNYNYQYGYKKKIVLDEYPELSNAVSMDAVEGYARTSTLESALATVTYDYDNRYLITANYRADGSSKFAKGHRWGHFGSVGGAWNFTNEHFMEGTEAADWLKNGKLRLSWGVLGNQDIGDMMFTDQYSIENVDGEKAYVWSYKGNPELTWERTSTVDLGLEFSIAKYLDAEFDFFYKKTDNMLFPRYVAPSLGYGGYYVNDAAMENHGIEFDLKGHLLDMRNIKLDLRVNGGYYRNKMLQMPIDGYNEDGTEKRMVMSGGMSVGHSTADYYMIHYEGVSEKGEAAYTAYYDANKGGFGHTSADLIEDGETGDNYIASVYEYKLKNPNANIQTTTVYNGDYTYAGSNYVGKSYMPDLDGGFGLDFEAYGVTLSISCSYRIGGYGYDNMYALLMHSERIGKRNWHKDIKNAWTETNTNTNIPRLSNGADDGANAASDRFLTSNSYLSLNNINLGYKFPKKWIEKIKLTNLQVWVAADNLAIASARKGYNPMMSASGTNGYNDYSPLSTVMAGVKVQF
ncbi:MAG: SusC/RagA family TonB-linked outer membrane protein [Paludibacteraceae bacterium]|nr:SusC/RagA family TonB-linked outer membrane protein [Paludibacteraceae bacterium]MBQ8940147.1 SusC/RagA family TonB-linked outer membrane protein [Paludibacteraceae bacterium]